MLVMVTFVPAVAEVEERVKVVEMAGAVTVNVFAALFVQFPPTGVILVVPALRVVIVFPETVATLVLELV